MTDPKHTPDAEAALRSVLEAWLGWFEGPFADGVGYINPPLGATREALAMPRTPRGSGEFRDWVVNDDGSVSPPGRPEARVFATPDEDGDGYLLVWGGQGTGVVTKPYVTFPEAARALLKALEENNE